MGSPIEIDGFAMPSRLILGLYRMEEGHAKLYTYMAILFGLLVLVGLLPRSSHQKLAPGVTVVGGDDKQAILASRERFRQGAKEMLVEGYTKARQTSQRNVPDFTK